MYNHSDPRGALLIALRYECLGPTHPLSDVFRYNKFNIAEIARTHARLCI